MSEAIWKPSKRIARSGMQRFLVAQRARLAGEDYAALHAWSIARPDEFWAAVWEFCGIEGEFSPDSVVRDFDRMPGARWFEGATLNFAENLLRRPGAGAAIVFANERGERDELSWDDLEHQVASVAAALRSFGVGRGDRVAGFVANRPEAVVAALATASVGAIWSSCSPDFGIDGVLDRFGQIVPKVLFATDGYCYAGKEIDSMSTVAAIAARLPQLAAVVVIPYRRERPDVRDIPRTHLFTSLTAALATPRFEALPFSAPLYILYSSGTTGVPKCIVHGAGGTLLQHQKEHVLHTDIGAGDTVFYFTTCGWMMWHWLVSTLACRARIVLYDGAPFYPDPGVLWRLAANEGISVFGTSAKYLSALEKASYLPREHVKLDALQTVLSTGSPLAPASFDFVYRDIKRDLQLSSIAGGTDLISCFALGNPILPVYRGELQCRGLGMKVEIFDADGRAVRQTPGELVCTAPFPSMPVGFWNDPDGSRYHAAYFERFPNVWCHGDYAELTAHDGLIIHGRSDAVLNPGGVRIGTSEIYRVVEQFPEVAESIAIGQSWQGDTRIVLFVRPQPGCRLDADLAARLREALARQASPRHRPAKVLEVADIPRTISGKIVELAVRDVVHGRPVKNRAALANPEALDFFRDRPELAE
jgi:acetoacetyl-CoA synthetase